MQRAVLAAALARGRSILHNPSYAEDCLASLGVAASLGAELQRESEAVIIKGTRNPQSSSIDCHESGLCLRMTCAICALFEQEFIISGQGSLMDRPLNMIEEPLRDLGAYCRTNRGKPPAVIRGPLTGGKIKLDASISSQFLSGLLMALPLCKTDSQISVTGLKSKPYVLMTLEILKAFGLQIDAGPDLLSFFIPGRQDYQAQSYLIEGDWSSAAAFLVAGAIAGSLEVQGLRADSTQADKAIVDVLRQAGALLTQQGPALQVQNASLKAFTFDAGDCPDLFPVLAALACNCQGQSIIKGASRLLYKESNRAEALCLEFSKLGGRISCCEDSLQVTGTKLRGGAINCHNDHRIAMACALAGLTSEQGVTIDHPEVVQKSYPDFFKDLQSIMVQL